MDNKEMSRCYWNATSNMHTIVTNFYENLHKENGQAIVDEILIRRKCNELIANIKIELSLIRDATREAREMRYQSYKFIRNSDEQD
jgi:hypothetical protein